MLVTFFAPRAPHSLQRASDPGKLEEEFARRRAVLRRHGGEQIDRESGNFR